MAIYNITFSPTGGTKKVVDILAAELGGAIVDVELCVSEKDLKIPELTENDVCLISVPSFGGRVPDIATDRISAFKANGAKAVLVCVYGNRAYEDALQELKDVAKEAGFKCFAAIAALAEHSIVRDIAKGRPDIEDEKILKSFAGKIKEKIEKREFEHSLQIPGNHTYKEYMKSKSVPKASENCIGCAECANGCPTSAIDFGNPRVSDDEKCASCMKCIAVCPINARALNEELLGALAERLGKVCVERKENELFV